MKKIRGKKSLIEQLQKIPIVQAACSASGISRATYYRWRAEDAKFASGADEAMSDGVEMINDIAESQLLNKIKDGSMPAIAFWLKFHSKHYKQTWLDAKAIQDEARKEMLATFLKTEIEVSPKTLKMIQEYKEKKQSEGEIKAE